MLGVLTRQPGRGGDSQAVTGQDHRLADLGNPAYQVVEEPAQPAVESRATPPVSLGHARPSRPQAFPADMPRSRRLHRPRGGILPARAVAPRTPALNRVPGRTGTCPVPSRAGSRTR